MAGGIEADDIGEGAADIDADREWACRGVHVSNYMIFGQDGQLAARQAQFPAIDLGVVFADQRRAPGDAPQRGAVDRGLPGIGEATAEVRVLDSFPEATVV